MEIPITIMLLRSHQGMLFYSNRNKMYSSMVFLFSSVIFVFVNSVDGFTYDDYLGLSGYDFCSNKGPEFFKTVCANAAAQLYTNNHGIEAVSDGSCKHEKSMKFVEPNALGAMVSEVWPPVLLCTFKDQGRVVSKKYFGQGKNKNDVFMYFLKQDDTLAGEKNLENVLVGV